MSKFDKAIRIPCKLSSNFFKQWLIFLTPLTHLTPKVIDVAAVLLRHRHELSRVISDDEILNKYLMGIELREKLLKELNITLPNHYMTLDKLRKAGFIIDGKINPKFIPPVKDNAGSFSLLLYFELLDGKQEEANISKDSESPGV